MIGALTADVPRPSTEDRSSKGRGAPQLHQADLELAHAAHRSGGAERVRLVERLRCVPRFIAVLNERQGRPFDDTSLEDLVQETLGEIWRRLPSYAGRASLETWAHRFCQLVVLDRLRAKRRRDPNVPIESAPEPAAPAATTLDFDHVYRALERLDPRAAAVVRRRHFDHWEFDRIARELELTEGNARSVYHRALARLREILEPLRKEARL